MRRYDAAMQRAGVVAIMVVLAGCTAQTPATDASASPSVTSATSTPSPATSERAPSATAEPSGSAGASLGPATGWQPTATFGGEGETTEYVTEVVSWAGGYAAIGDRWDGAPAGEGLVPFDARLWLSTDGHAWTEGPMPGGDDLTLLEIAALPDGDLALFGVIGREAQGAGDTVVPQIQAWTSSDASSWTAVLADDGPLEDPLRGRVASGPVGTVIGLSDAFHFSADLATWSDTAATFDGGIHALAAGDEGFMAIGVRTAEDRQSQVQVVMASGNGTDWFPATIESDVTFLEVRPFGPDWLATTFEQNGEIGLWRSANGLDWDRVLLVNDLTPPEGPKSGKGMESEITGASIATSATDAYLTLTWNHCCVELPVNVGVWHSTDGATWAEAEVADSFIRAVAVGEAGTVLGGHRGRGDEAAFWLAD